MRRETHLKSPSPSSMTLTRSRTVAEPDLGAATKEAREALAALNLKAESEAVKAAAAPPAATT